MLEERDTLVEDSTLLFSQLKMRIHIESIIVAKSACASYRPTHRIIASICCLWPKSDFVAYLLSLINIAMRCS